MHREAGGSPSCLGRYNYHADRPARFKSSREVRFNDKKINEFQRLIERQNGVNAHVTDSDKATTVRRKRQMFRSTVRPFVIDLLTADVVMYFRSDEECYCVIVSNKLNCASIKMSCKEQNKMADKEIKQSPKFSENMIIRYKE